MENNIEISEQSKVKELYRRVCTFLGRYRGVALLYAIFYTLLFLPIFHGAGQYWDWNFPYFKDQVPNIFWNYAFSWLGADTGAPMSYLSDYYVRMLFSLTGYLFLEPEYFRYFFIVGIFTVTSFGTYLFVVSTVP